jgi:hypothetical protein
MMEVVIKPIRDGIKSWVRNIGNSLEDTWNEYKTTGTISSSSAEDIANAIFGGGFITAIFVILTIIDGITTLISPFIALVSGLVASVAKFVMPIIMAGVSSTGPEGKALADMAQAGITLQQITNIIGDHLGELGLILAFVSLLVSMKSFINTINTPPVKGVPWGKTNAVFFLILTLIGVGIVGTACLFDIAGYEIPHAILTLIGVLFSGYALALSVINLISFENCKGLLNKLSVLVAGVSFGLSLAAAVKIQWKELV